jgi:uncharacterized protein (DUF1499 family)
MKKQTKRTLTGLISVVVLVLGALAMMSFFSYKPSNPGIIDGRLADCPASPNCVSTQAVDADHRMEPIPFTGSPDEMMQRIEAVIAEMTQTKIVTTEGNYLHAEFRSALFRFVDDVEFLIDPESQLVHFRSASRVGYSDFGVNRRRMEEIREAFGK